MSCLNVFGSAGLASGSTVKKPAAQAVDLDGGGAGGGGGSGGGRRDKGKGRADADPAAGNARLDQWFAPEKGTGMRLSYGGPGHPLTLFVCVPRESISAGSTRPRPRERADPRCAPPQRRRGRGARGDVRDHDVGP